jgi:hypothetical protein
LNSLTRSFALSTVTGSGVQEPVESGQQVRQSFIFQHTYLDTTAIFHLIKHTDA